jgi:hypothetical protein
MQGSVLLLFYEFLHLNSFFVDFVFYDNNNQRKSSGMQVNTQLLRYSQARRVFRVHGNNVVPRSGRELGLTRLVY